MSPFKHDISTAYPFIAISRSLANGPFSVENVQMGRRIIYILIYLFLILPAVAEAGIQTLVIDPGHGGYDVGILSETVKEKDTVLELAREMKSILLTVDIDVELTRKIDHYQSISERRSKANAQSPDIFLSLHFTEGDHFTVYTTWYEKPYSELSIQEFYDIESRQRKNIHDSERMANTVAKAIRGQFEGKKVFVRKMPLPLISSIGAPSILVEVPSEGIAYDEELFRVASTLVLGVLRYDEQ